LSRHQRSAVQFLDRDDHARIVDKGANNPEVFAARAATLSENPQREQS